MPIYNILDSYIRSELDPLYYNKEDSEYRLYTILRVILENIRKNSTLEDKEYYYNILLILIVEYSLILNSSLEEDKGKLNKIIRKREEERKY